MNTTVLLANYESMAHLSQQMLEAAKAEAWDQLLELEKSRNLVEAELQRSDSGTWGKPDSLKKSQIIRAILHANDEIKMLTQNWIGGLQNNLGSLTMERRLKQAYDTP